ncbi:MAG: hypothetical protein ACYS7Y_30545 [Planctomycetota bacterium]|jgi:hypothetical protein
MNEHDMSEARGRGYRTYSERFTNALTMENAVEWEHLTDKFVFCLDLLELSAQDEGVDERVEELEKAFEEMLEGA